MICLLLVDFRRDCSYRRNENEFSFLFPFSLIIKQNPCLVGSKFTQHGLYCLTFTDPAGDDALKDKLEVNGQEEKPIKLEPQVETAFELWLTLCHVRLLTYYYDGKLM